MSWINSETGVEDVEGMVRVFEGVCEVLAERVAMCETIFLLSARKTGKTNRSVRLALIPQRTDQHTILRFLQCNPSTASLHRRLTEGVIA